MTWEGEGSLVIPGFKFREAMEINQKVFRKNAVGFSFPAGSILRRLSAYQIKGDPSRDGERSRSSSVEDILNSPLSRCISEEVALDLLKKMLEDYFRECLLTYYLSQQGGFVVYECCVSPFFLKEPTYLHYLERLASYNAGILAGISMYGVEVVSATLCACAKQTIH